MPLLSDEGQAYLLLTARLYFHRAAKDYCRTCDEFYWLNSDSELKHYGHRLTIVPFVEVR